MSAEIDRIRVAVASGDGTLVDRHFATSPSFRIHDFDGRSWQFIEIRQNSDGACACGDGLTHRSFDPLVELLRDCHFVVAMQIGPAAAISLFQRGIRAHVAFGPVDEVLRNFQSSSKLQHPLPKQRQVRA